MPRYFPDGVSKLYRLTMKIYIARLPVIGGSAQLGLQHNHPLVAIANHAIEHLPSIRLQNYTGRISTHISRTKNADSLDWFVSYRLIFGSQNGTPLRAKIGSWK
jgi:hypothetical protein